MKQIEIHTFEELHQIIEAYDERTIIYRGMKSAKFPLIPKIGRIVPPRSIGSRETNEQEILRLFQERALRFIDFMPTTDWDWLALGQQHGLPTRLLDWTNNPLVACYFCAYRSGYTLHFIVLTTSRVSGVGKSTTTDSNRESLRGLCI